MRDNVRVSTPEQAETQREPVPDRPQQTRPRRIGLFLAVALVALALDVVSKVLVVAQLSGDAPKRTLGGLVYLDLARNSGAAFSLGTGFTVILTAVAAVVVVIILRTASRMHSVGWAVSLGLILGGALGNLSDRVFRAPGVGRGHVVDWISVFGPNGQHWPIFNIADSAICCGAVLAAILALRGIDLDGGAGPRD
jgi:signal peptidase II